MLKLEEARNIILECTGAMTAETVDILQSLNRVAAEDVYSYEDIPPFNNSAMDGYAVLSLSLKGSSEKEPSILKLAGKIPAGHISQNIVQADSAVKIMTGGAVPEGADAVIPVEFTEEDGNWVKIFKEAKKWENIRFAGEDVKKGQIVIPKGKLLRPAEIGMLAALNKRSVKVSRMPVIGILVTGDELIEPGEELMPGKIRNINGYSLYAKALKHGCKVISLGTARDSREDIREKLQIGRKCDILIISGGVSIGDYDHVKNVLLDMGMEEKFWKVAIKPGKPVLFGVMESTLIFGLPGNPVSSMVAFEQFVLPSIFKIQGRNDKSRNEFKVPLEGEISKALGLTNFIRGKTIFREGRIYVRPTGPQSSGMFSSMVLADCLIMVPENITKIKNGEEVLIQITDEIGE